MKYRKILIIFIIMHAVLCFVLLNDMSVSKEPDSTIAVAVQDGVTVTSDNPLAVEPGGTAVFNVEIDDNYEFVSSSDGVYKDGVLTIENAQPGKTVYIYTLKYCKVALGEVQNGSAKFISADTVLEGESVSLKLKPNKNYVIGSIEVNGTSYPVPTDENFTFVVQDDSVIDVEFWGKELDFLTVSNNLGFVSIDGNTETFRYGDIIPLSCDFESENIVFDGWSVGNFIEDGGKLISKDPNYNHQLFESVTLYANFRDKYSYTLSFDANGGKIKKNLDKEYSPGTYINLPLSSKNISRDSHTLIGFCADPNGEGEIYAPGAMFEIPRENTVLYAQWVKNTKSSYFKYRAYSGKIAILGLSKEGKEANLSTIVIPAKIDNRSVVTIAESAFQGCESLETLVLPVGLLEIKDLSFADCPNLSTVYFPETLTSMKNNAFENCDSFENMRVLASLNRAFDRHFNSALAGKYMRLKNTEGKRIIFVAGSSLAFGLNSALVKDQFPDYDVINFGVTRYYGMLPLMDILEDNVHEGDIVVFCPEYFDTMYAAKQQPQNTNWMYLESNYDILKDINIQKDTVFLRYYINYLNEKRDVLPNKLRSANPIYATSSFNRYGDITANRDSMANCKTCLPDPEIITEAGIGAFNALSKQLTEKGAICCFSFPGCASGGESEKVLREKTKDFVTKLKSLLDEDHCPIISDICDYYFDDELLYDTAYHLTDEGADIRTKNLIADLKAYLED